MRKRTRASALLSKTPTLQHSKQQIEDEFEQEDDQPASLPARSCYSVAGGREALLAGDEPSRREMKYPWMWG